MCFSCPKMYVNKMMSKIREFLIWMEKFVPWDGILGSVCKPGDGKKGLLWLIFLSNPNSHETLLLILYSPPQGNWTAEDLVNALCADNLSENADKFLSYFNSSLRNAIGIDCDQDWNMTYDIVNSLLTLSRLADQVSWDRWKYRKFPKYSDTQKICCNHSKIWTMWLYHRVMSPNDADGMANSVDPDLGLHCLPRPVCQKT